MVYSEYQAQGVWVDNQDHIYVSWIYGSSSPQPQTGFIAQYSSSGTLITTFRANSNSAPIGVTGDNNGYLYYGEGNYPSIIKLTISTNDVSMTIRNGKLPLLIGIDNNYNIYALDGQVGVIMVLNSTGGFIKYIPNIIDGSVIFMTATVDAAGTTVAAVVNNGYTIDLYSTRTGTLIRSFSVPDVNGDNYIDTIAFDSSLNIYYAGEFGSGSYVSQIVVVSETGTFIRTITAPFFEEHSYVQIDSHITFLFPMVRFFGSAPYLALLSNNGQPLLLKLM